MSNDSSFTWGVATSSYQIEGAVAEDGRGPSIWDTYCKKPGVIADGTDGVTACDHYHRYRDDVRLIKNLGVDAYRFSIAWPRLFPQGTGALNKKGLDFYSRLVDALLENGLQPWVTLYHWDLPQALQDKGGWTNRDIVKWFCDYAGETVRHLSDRVSHFILLNEPSVTVFPGHIEGTNAPGLRDLKAGLAATHHQNLAIGEGFRALKSLSGKLTVGSSYTLFPIRAAQDTPEGRHAREVMDCLWNKNFFDPLNKGEYPETFRKDFDALCRPGDLEKIKTPLDFIGVQHYSPAYAHAMDTNPAGAGFRPAARAVPQTDMGWPIEAAAFEECLLWFRDRYGDKNLVVTENGAAFADRPAADGSVQDTDRIEYFEQYLAAMNRAMKKGVRVSGYFIWSFLDNFEWAFGLSKRFGIVYIDYEKDLKRIPKQSFHWWKDYLAKLKGVKRDRQAGRGS